MDIPDRDIPFDARSYLEVLIRAMNGTARDRFVSFIQQQEQDEEEQELGRAIGRARGRKRFQSIVSI
ncbi:hypothetical protein V1522DRAFT_407831 [Lipomyces starkeyi]